MVRATEFQAEVTDEAGAGALPIVAVLNDGHGAVYDVIAEAANRLRDEGWRLAGAVQAGVSRQARSACDMMLTVLPDGPQIGIAQDLGEGGKGCRLDQAALEEAVALVDRSLNETTQIVLLNKFGARESEGAGFRATIARAITNGIPVVVGISEAHLSAFAEFAGDDAPVLSPRVDDIHTWCRQNAS